MARPNSDKSASISFSLTGSSGKDLTYEDAFDRAVQAWSGKAGVQYEWDDIKRDLCALQEIELELEDTRWFLRTDLRKTCAAVFGAVGVAIPPSIRS
jgi:hypothetical protein